MSKKVLISGLLVCVLSLFFAMMAVRFTNLNFPKESSGRLVFEKTFENSLIFNKMVLKTPEGIITFEQDNNFWKVKEADYYYANLEFLNNLFIAFNNSRYWRQQEYSPQALLADGLGEKEGFTISTYADDFLLDKIKLGKKTENLFYTFAQPNLQKEIWLIDGEFLLPDDVYSWLMQPLISYSNNMIETLSIESDDGVFVANRENDVLPFFDNEGKIVNPLALLERFNFLTFEKVLSVNNFDETSFSKKREISLTTFSGLVTKINLFYDEDNYWIKISFLTTNLPTAAVNDYIKDNTFLYDGWYFKLPMETGRVLSNFKLV